MAADDRNEIRDQLAELVSAFNKRLGARAEELEDALRAALAGDAGAAAEAARIVHKLSGTAGSFGAVELSEAASAVDQRLRAGSTTAELERQIRTLVELMRARAS